jgi:hypothetical protein
VGKVHLNELWLTKSKVNFTFPDGGKSFHFGLKLCRPGTTFNGAPLNGKALNHSVGPDRNGPIN